jgi:hypothetical protein
MVLLKGFIEIPTAFSSMVEYLPGGTPWAKAKDRPKQIQKVSRKCFIGCEGKKCVPKSVF